jgi:hypothetical protein
MEEGCEVEVSGPKETAMVLADVYVSEPLAHFMDGPDQVVLLDVHVVGIEVNDDIVLADIIGQPKRISGGVDDVGLLAVADFETDGHVEPAGLLG